VYSRAETLFILEHYFAFKSYASVREVLVMVILTRKYQISHEFTYWLQNIVDTVLATRNMSGIRDFNKILRRPTLRTQQLCCRGSFLRTFLSVFGHRDRQTSFWGDFSEKEFIQ
jgi:hypothetical protein